MGGGGSRVRPGRLAVTAVRDDKVVHVHKPVGKATVDRKYFHHTKSPMTW